MFKLIQWFEIHDISNLTQAKHQRLPNKAVFFSISDARIKWLEDFLQWLNDLKKSVAAKDHFLTIETFKAITITTKSSIAKITFLINTTGFKYVLTRKFNSNNLERKFSALPQANGRNYNMEAKAAIYGVEKLLRTAITYCAMNGNVTFSRKKQQRSNKKFLRATSVKVPKERALNVLRQLQIEELVVLDELKRPPGTSFRIMILPLHFHNNIYY